MKIVIDIPEGEYNEIEPFLNGEIIKGGFNLFRVLEMIKSGTPLPKGHGRLIDEKDLSLMTVHMIDGMLVCEAPTIIEADKTEGEDKA